MSNNIFKTQFSAGELSPALHARVDSGIYQSGAKKLRNMFVRPHGGVANRAGTIFIGQCKSNLSYVPTTRTVRIIPFQFSQKDAYIIELGQRYMRVIRQGGYVLTTDNSGVTIENNITLITKAAQATVTTKVAHGYKTGDWVYFTGVGGMAEINGRTLIVDAHDTMTFTLLELDGYPLDSTNFTNYTVPAGGSSNGRVYEIFTKSTIYDAEDIFDLVYVQSGDVMTLTHKDYPAQTLTRQNHAVWRFDEIDFKPTVTKVGTITIDSTHSDSINIDSITVANPAIITLDTTATALWARGVAGRIVGAGGMDDVNNNVYMLGEQISAKVFQLVNTSLEGINSTTFDAYTPNSGTFVGTTLYRYQVSAVDPNGRESRATSAPVVISRPMSDPYDAGTAPPKIILRWASVAGASSYNIYRQKEIVNGAPSIGSRYGFVGNTTTPEFTDQNISPDFTKSPAQFYNPFQKGQTVSVLENIVLSNPAQIYTTTPHGLVIGDRVLIEKTGNTVEAEGLLGRVINFSVDWIRIESITDQTDYDGTSWSDFTPPITAITKANPAVITLAGGHNFGNGDLVYVGGITGMTQMNGTVGYVEDRSPTTIKVRKKSTGLLVDSTAFSTYVSGGIVRSNEGTVTRVTPINLPMCSAYFQQRRVFGGSNENPQTIWFTQSGDYTNMDRSDPIRESDSIEITVASLQINQIKFIVPIASLLVLTGAGCYKVGGGDSGKITPVSINATQQTFSGCGDLQPLILNNDILFTSSQTTNVLALAYNFYQDSYQTQDLSIRSRHLVDGFTIRDWAYGRDPENIVYMIRSDGKLLMMTYLKEAEVVAWSQGDTEGEYGVDTFESVCCVTEGNENVVYVVANRRICNENGCSFRKYVERINNRSRLYNGVADTKRGYFVDSGVFYDGEPINVIKNLEHLEGRTVQIVADGNVLAPVVVKGGKVTLARYANVIIIGLGYTSEIETLPLDVGNGAISGKRKSIKAVTLRLVNSRGVEVGIDDKTLVAFREITGSDDWTIIPLQTGDLRYTMYGNQNTQGSIIIRQNLPLPMDISGAILEVVVGDTP